MERLDLTPIKKRLANVEESQTRGDKGTEEWWIPGALADLFEHAQEDITALIAEVEYWKDKYMNPRADGL